MAYPPKKPLSKVQVLALSYYARKDVQQAIFEFCKHRETVANFNNEFFAKRPDCFDYASDKINEHINKNINRIDLIFLPSSSIGIYIRLQFIFINKVNR